MKTGQVLGVFMVLVASTLAVLAVEIVSDFRGTRRLLPVAKALAALTIVYGCLVVWYLGASLIFS